MCTTLYTFAKGMCTTLYTFLVYNVRFTLIVQCKLIIALVKIKKGMKKNFWEIRNSQFQYVFMEMDKKRRSGFLVNSQHLHHLDKLVSPWAHTWVKRGGHRFKLQKQHKCVYV